MFHRAMQDCVALVKLVEEAKDNSISHGFVSWPYDRRLRYHRCRIDKDLLISEVDCGEDFKLWLGFKGASSPFFL